MEGELKMNKKQCSGRKTCSLRSRILRKLITYGLPAAPATVLYAALTNPACAGCPLAAACPLRLAPLAILYALFAGGFRLLTEKTGRLRRLFRVSGRGLSSRNLGLAIILVAITATATITLAGGGPDKLIVEPTEIQAKVGDVVKIHVKVEFAHPQPCPAAKYYYVEVKVSGDLEPEKTKYTHDDMHFVSKTGEFDVNIKVMGSGTVTIIYHYSDKCPFNKGGIEQASVKITAETPTTTTTTTTTTTATVTAPATATATSSTVPAGTTTITQKTSTTTTETTTTTPAPVKAEEHKISLESLYNSRAILYYALLVIGVIGIPATMLWLQTGKKNAIRRFSEKKSSIISKASTGSKARELENALVEAIGEAASKNRMITKLILWLRWALVAVVVVLLILIPFAYVGLICPCPMWVPQAILLSENLPRDLMDAAIVVIIVALVSTIVLRRAWCGWICPLGLTQDLLAKVYGRARITGKTDVVLRVIKYVFLAVLVILVLTSSTIWLCIHCFISTPLSALRYQSFVGGALFWTLVALGALFFIGSMIVPRFFCRYICPAGALLEGVGLLAPLKVHKTERCKECGECTAMNSCPMGLAEPGETECISCLNCVRNCPFKAIEVGSFKTSKKG